MLSISVAVAHNPSSGLGNLGVFTLWDIDDMRFFLLPILNVFIIITLSTMMNLVRGHR